MSSSHDPQRRQRREIPALLFNAKSHEGRAKECHCLIVATWASRLAAYTLCFAYPSRVLRAPSRLNPAPALTRCPRATTLNGDSVAKSRRCFSTRSRTKDPRRTREGMPLPDRGYLGIPARGLHAFASRILRGSFARLRVQNRRLHSRDVL